MLLTVTPAVAEKVSVELLPQGTLSLRMTAATQALAQLLGTSLGHSLGCSLSEAAVSPAGDEWEFHALCSGVFHRRGQLLEGQLAFGGFRQALIAASVDEIELDLAAPCAPYSEQISPSWRNRICRNGMAHFTGVIAPDRLSAKTNRVVVGYRNADLALIFATIPCFLLLGFGLLMWLNLSAQKATQMDSRGLWLCYQQGLIWGLAGIFLLWAATWAAISGEYTGDSEVWEVFSVWNGRPASVGRWLAAILDLGPALLITPSCVWWRPKVFAALSRPQHRVLDTIKAVLLPALALIVPARASFTAVEALSSGDLKSLVGWLLVAALAGALIRPALRYGRAKRAPVLESGEIYDRLRALATRCGITQTEIRVASTDAAVLAEPIEVEGGRVVLSEYALSVLAPTEVEAEVARRWSLPLRAFAIQRQLPLFFLALCLSLLLAMTVIFVASLMLVWLRVRPPVSSKVLAQVLVPLTIGWALIAARWMYSRLMRRADHRAAILMGEAESVTRAAEKLAAMQMAPWKWKHAPLLPLV